MAAPALWSPPADVRAAIAAVRVREAQGSPEDDGRPVQLAPSPAVMQFATELRRRFPGITSTGTRAGANHHNPGGARDLHEEGRAVDAMSGLATGEQVANYVSRHAQVLGVQGVIFNREAWWSDGRGLRAYHGASPHTDHAHLEVGPDAARWSAAQMAAAFQQADAADAGVPWWGYVFGALAVGAAVYLIVED